MAGTSTVGGVLPQKVIVIRHPCLWEECEAALIAPTHGWFDNPFHVFKHAWKSRGIHCYC